MTESQPSPPPRDPAGGSPPGPSTGIDRFTVALVGAIVVALAAFGWLLASVEPAAGPEVGEGAVVLPEPIALPDVSLIDAEGEPFGRDDLEGHWSLLFFGYTYCPDVCPIVLSELARVHALAGEEPALGPLPEVVFVSVDPGRDTPERLAEYMPFFDPAFRGVTGREEEIAELTRTLGVFHAIREPGESGDYLVDHASKLWLVDPEARYVALLEDPHEPRPFLELLARIRALGGES